MKQKYILGCMETQVVWYGPYAPKRFMRRYDTNMMPVLFNSISEAMDEAEKILQNMPAGSMRLAVTYMFIFENEPLFITEQMINPANPATQLQAKQLIQEAQGKSEIEREEVLAMAATKFELLTLQTPLN